MCTCDTAHASSAAEPALAGTSFKVEDMTCAHCAGTIRNALLDGMPGTQFDVDLERQIVTVAGDAGQAEAIIRDAGYEPQLLAH